MLYEKQVFWRALDVIAVFLESTSLLKFIKY